MTNLTTISSSRSFLAKSISCGILCQVLAAIWGISVCQTHAQDTGLADTNVVASVEDTLAGLFAQALRSLQNDDRESAIKAADAIVRLAPDDANAARQAGDIYLRCGKAKWAVRMFDRYLEAKPAELAGLWQRGIALYLTQDFQAGIAQFEEHQKVNPNDVENAAWHFLCVAKLHSPDEAKRRVLPAPNDPRVPMEEVLRMLTTGDTAAVAARVKETPDDSKAREMASFYGDFYLGLYADALGDQEQAKSSLKRAATDAPRNYMGDVARVYSEWLSQRDL